MIFDTATLTAKQRYKLTIGAILPRPIAWVSTMDRAGNLNIAPFSYFTAVCPNPMTLLFSVSYSPQKGGKKDTLRNVEEVPEFVINLTNEDTAEAMNRTATILRHGVSEFEWAGLTPAPSESIRVPRIAEAPISYECKLQRIVTVSDQPGGGSVVFGEVQRIHVDDDIFDADRGYILLDKYRPIGRLGGAGYTRVSDTFEMERLPPPDDLKP